jgi:hypothetical protein
LTSCARVTTEALEQIVQSMLGATHIWPYIHTRFYIFIFHAEI